MSGQTFGAGAAMGAGDIPGQTTFEGGGGATAGVGAPASSAPAACDPTSLAAAIERLRGAQNLSTQVDRRTVILEAAMRLEGKSREPQERDVNWVRTM